MADPGSARTQARSIANWVTLATPLGLLISRVGGCRVRPGPRGLSVASGYRLAIPGARAFTVGNVIVVREERHLLQPQLFAHEERHASQWALCLGVIGFPPCYGLAALWSFLLTGDAHSRNVFERRAGLAAGGYRVRSVRWRRRAG